MVNLWKKKKKTRAEVAAESARNQAYTAEVQRTLSEGGTVVEKRPTSRMSATRAPWGTLVVRGRGNPAAAIFQQRPTGVDAVREAAKKTPAAMQQQTIQGAQGMKGLAGGLTNIAAEKDPMRGQAVNAGQAPKGMSAWHKMGKRPAPSEADLAARRKGLGPAGPGASWQPRDRWMENPVEQTTAVQGVMRQLQQNKLPGTVISSGPMQRAQKYIEEREAFRQAEAEAEAEAGREGKRGAKAGQRVQQEEYSPLNDLSPQQRYYAQRLSDRIDEAIKGGDWREVRRLKLQADNAGIPTEVMSPTAERYLNKLTGDMLPEEMDELNKQREEAFGWQQKYQAVFDKQMKAYQADLATARANQDMAGVTRAYQRALDLVGGDVNQLPEDLAAVAREASVASQTPLQGVEGARTVLGLNAPGGAGIINRAVYGAPAQPVPPWQQPGSQEARTAAKEAAEAAEKKRLEGKTDAEKKRLEEKSDAEKLERSQMDEVAAALSGETEELQEAGYNAIWQKIANKEIPLSVALKVPKFSQWYYSEHPEFLDMVKGGGKAPVSGGGKRLPMKKEPVKSDAEIKSGIALVHNIIRGQWIKRKELVIGSNPVSFEDVTVQTWKPAVTYMKVEEDPRFRDKTKSRDDLLDEMYGDKNTGLEGAYWRYKRNLKLAFSDRQIIEMWAIGLEQLGGDVLEAFVKHSPKTGEFADAFKDIAEVKKQAETRRETEEVRRAIELSEQ